jgi:Xaa-Pro aminopeptidase
MLIREKIEQAKQILEEFDVDCWITYVRESDIVTDPSLVYLVASPVTWHSAFIITSGGATHAVVGRFDMQAVQDTGVWDTVEGYDEGVSPQLTSYLKKLDPKKIAANFSEASEIADGLTHGMYLNLRRILAEIGMEDRLMSAERVVSALRERKSATELYRMGLAAAATQEVFGRVAEFIRPGKTEREIASFMQDRVREMGLDFAWVEEACPSVFTGPDTAGAHYAPTERKVERGHVLNMDFGVKVEDYCSDMQRSFYVLEEGETAAPPEVQRAFDTLVSAIENARNAVKPGAIGLEADTAARSTIVDAGYEEFPHGLGHQVGRFAHDGTALLGPEWEKYGDKPHQPLEENMVFTIEPRIPVPGRGIVTIEEMVVVTGDGAEYLGSPQKELLLIG